MIMYQINNIKKTHLLSGGTTPQTKIEHIL